MSRIHAWRTALRPHLGTANWAVLDQAISSGTNFVLAILVVRLVSKADFGAFSISVLIYVLGVGLTRAFTTEPLTIRHARDRDEISLATPQGLGGAVALGAAVGVLCIVGAAFVSGSLAEVLLVTGLTFPLLMVQDSARGIFFARQEPKRAAFNDGLWAVLQTILMIVAHALHARVVGFVAAWLVSGALAGALSFVQLRALPRIRSGIAWMLRHRSLGVPLFWNFVLMSAPPYVLFALTPLVAGLAVLGEARAAYLPLSPFGLLLQSSWMLLLPMTARRQNDQIRRLSMAASFALGTLALGWSAVAAFAVPGSLGIKLFGETWHQTYAARIVFGAALVGQGFGIGPLLALRAVEKPAALLRVRLLTAPLTVAVGLLASLRWDSEGVALGIAFGAIATTLLSWQAQHKVLGSATAPTPVPTASQSSGT